MKSALVLSDLHLGEAHGASAGRSLAELLRRNPTADLILAGDTFDLTLAPEGRSPEDQLACILRAQPEFREALIAHRLRGNSVTIIPGNHDAALKTQEAVARLQTDLGRPVGGSFSVSDWFIRFGRAHIEHGHQYDVDNAFVHPLAPFRAGAEPLGTALMREFVQPTGTLTLAHAHETTPVAGLLRVIRQFGPRAPYIVFMYFKVALALCVRAARDAGTTQDKTGGELALRELAERLGESERELSQLVHMSREPTHRSLTKTWTRLYLDQVSAALLGAVALGMMASGGSLGQSASAAALSGALVGWRRLRPIDYHARMNEAARESAALIKHLRGVELVVFGHTHSAHVEDGYVNLGSFGYGKEARPYLLLAEDGSHQLLRTS